jgi:hypothetical protein
MKSRCKALPSVRFALVTVSLLLGLVLAPVAAQQVALSDGQVTVRSDGTVYLILNGQRRWVATVDITDEDLNAYPEAEPIYTALAPMGSTPSFSQQPSTTPTATSRTTSSPGASSSGSGSARTASGTPSSADPNSKVDPISAKECPAGFKVKGGFDRKYYDVDRPNYPNVEVEACFTSGSAARSFGYTSVK